MTTSLQNTIFSFDLLYSYGQLNFCQYYVTHQILIIVGDRYEGTEIIRKNNQPESQRNPGRHRKAFMKNAFDAHCGRKITVLLLKNLKA